MKQNQTKNDDFFRALNQELNQKSAKDEMLAERLANKTKHLIYPQMLKDWKCHILKNYTENGKTKDEFFEIVKYMKLLKNKMSLDKIADKFNSGKHQLDSKTLFIVAYYCKDGPKLFRKALGNRVTPSVEKDLKGFENKHLKYDEELQNGKKKPENTKPKEVIEQELLQNKQLAAKAANQTKSLIYPQMVKDWERVIEASFIQDGKLIEEYYEVVKYMKLLKTTPLDLIAKTIESQDYDLSFKIKTMFTVAFYCKDGPKLFRKAFGIRVTPSVERDLLGFEHNHRIYEKQLKEERSK